MVTIIPTLPYLGSNPGRHGPTRNDVRGDGENCLMGSFKFSAYTKYYYSDHVKVYEWGWVCNTDGKYEKYVRTIVGRTDRKRLLGA
jgi:hypothetical protein